MSGQKRAHILKLSTIIRAVESQSEQLTERLTEEEQEVRNLDKENNEKKHLLKGKGNTLVYPLMKGLTAYSTGAHLS